MLGDFAYQSAPCFDVVLEARPVYLRDAFTCRGSGASICLGGTDDALVSRSGLLLLEVGQGPDLVDGERLILFTAQSSKLEQ